MGGEETNETVAAFFREARATAKRIREYNQQRVEQEIAAYKRTIDIEVETISEAKASEILEQKLKTSTEWIKLQKDKHKANQKKWDDFRECLFWLIKFIGYGWSGWTFYIVSSMLWATIGGMILINIPEAMVCDSSLCSLLRWDKKHIMKSGETDEILHRYIKNHSNSSKKRERGTGNREQGKKKT